MRTQHRSACSLVTPALPRQECSRQLLHAGNSLPSRNRCSAAEPSDMLRRARHQVPLRLAAVWGCLTLHLVQVDRLRAQAQHRHMVPAGSDAGVVAQMHEVVRQLQRVRHLAIAGPHLCICIRNSDVEGASDRTIATLACVTPRQRAGSDRLPRQSRCIAGMLLCCIPLEASAQSPARRASH